MSSRAQAMQDRIDEQEGANPWRMNAEVGDTLAGEVEYVDVRTTKHNPETPVLGIRDDNGLLHEVYGFGTVLLRKILEARPQPGEFVYIKRMEDKVSQARRESYQVFKFVVDREAAKRFDWNRLDPGSGEAPAEEDRPLTHEETTRKLVEQDRDRGPGPVEDVKQEPPAGEIADEDWRAPWDD